MTEWMTVPECAEALGVPMSRVRELLRERHLVAQRRGDNQAWYLPAEQLSDGPEGPAVVATVRGTVMLLADAGLGEDEIVTWLITEHEELGMSPLAALRSGQRAHVRRLAQAL